MMSNQVNNNNEKGIEEDAHRGGHESRLQNDDEADDHDQDMVMPGFRFHPTEEELIEFYLRRKVEGKRFNVELITFLDLYRYDPWELPGKYNIPHVYYTQRYRYLKLLLYTLIHTHDIQFIKIS